MAHGVPCGNALFVTDGATNRGAPALFSPTEGHTVSRMMLKACLLAGQKRVQFRMHFAVPISSAGAEVREVRDILSFEMRGPSSVRTDSRPVMRVPSPWSLEGVDAPAASRVFISIHAPSRGRCAARMAIARRVVVSFPCRRRGRAMRRHKLRQSRMLSDANAAAPRIPEVLQLGARRRISLNGDRDRHAIGADETCPPRLETRRTDLSCAVR